MQLNRKPEVDVEDATIFLSPEEMPEFPGGYAALLNFLGQNIKYPSIAAENGISGKVTVNFVVNKDGTISEAKIIRGVDQAIDKEALRVVYSLPKWKPGKQGGKPVKVSYYLPINFVLQ
jgi:protein TonB